MASPKKRTRSQQRRSPAHAPARSSTQAPSAPEIVDPRSPQFWKQSWVLLFVSMLIVGTIYRLYISFTDLGIYWPDEIFQSLEPAHYLVFGYALLPWEYLDALRNWTFPALFYLPMKLSALVGKDDPFSYIMVTRVFLCIWAGATAWATYFLARSIRIDRLSSSVAATFYFLIAPVLYFSHRGLSEIVSMLPVLLGLAFCLRSNPRRNDIVIGASLLGFATLLRIHNGYFCVAIVVTLLLRKQYRLLGWAFLTLIVWAFVYGAIDWITWGAPFKSAINYLRINIVESKSTQYGVSPWYFYLDVLWQSMTAPLVVALLLAIFGLRNAVAVATIALIFLIGHSLIGHKEIRFVVIVIPLLAVIAGAGLAWIKTHKPLWRYYLALTICLLATVASMFNTAQLTTQALGIDGPPMSAWHRFEPLHRLFIDAHKQRDLCGLAVPELHLTGTGGHAFLHRKVPVYGLDAPRAIEQRFVNYVIRIDPEEKETNAVARHGVFALVPLGFDSCAPDVSYPWRVN